MRLRFACLTFVAIGIFAVSVRAATIPGNGVQIVAPADPSAVARYDKLELLITLTTTATKFYNPDPASVGVDLSASFTAPDATVTKVYGFYDGANWRVRFAPTKTGAWTFTVAAADSGGTASWSGGSFTCVASSFPGFARIDGTYLRFSEGQAQFAVGHNNGWQYDVEQPTFSSMSAQGENLLSFWMNSPWKTPTDSEPRCPIENITQGVGVYNQPACAYLDGVVSRAEASGVYLLPSIWSHGNLRFFNPNNSSDPQNHPWGQGWWSNNAYSGICTAADFFKTAANSVDTAQWTAQKNYYRYILARWGYSRAIIGWVALVEIEGTTGYGSNGSPAGYANPAQATAWCGSVRNYFAANDPYRLNALSKYPIGVSQTDWTSGSTTWANGCDLAAIDSYTQQTNAIAVATAISNEIGGGGGVTAMRASNKPSFVAEFGAQEPNSNYNTYQPAHFHNGIWAGTAAGACMTPLLWCDEGQFPMLTDANVGAALRTQLQNLSQFMAGIPYIGDPNLTPASISVSASNFNARGMRLSDRGFGWIQNKGGNVGGQTVTVSGLTPGQYNVFWYDTWSSGGTALSVQPQVVTVPSGGSLVAAVPTPTTPRADLAFKFFVNAAPTISIVATANPTTAYISTTLTVLGADDAGEANLVYHWKVAGTPHAAPSFSINDSNAAKSTVATFHHNDGTYPTMVYVTVTDAAGASVDSAFVTIQIPAIPTTVVVTPSSATVGLNQSQNFYPLVYDQFGGIVPQGYVNYALMTYAVSGGGTVNGVTFTAGSIPGGPYTFTATYPGVSGTASVVVVNTAPSISAATANPAAVTGTSTTLSVTATDDAGEAGLNYTWSVVSAPPGANVTFSPNGTNAGKSATAQFSALGDYVLSVSASDSGNMDATATVNVSVQQTLTTLDLAPQSPVLNSNGSQQFTATPRDQFGTAITAPVLWAVSGGGSISASGFLSAQTASGGPFTVTATSGAVLATTTFTVVNAAPAIQAVTAGQNTVVGTTTTLHVDASDDGGEAALTYTWSVSNAPAGGGATFSTNSSNAAKDTGVTFTSAGDYVIKLIATDGAGVSTSGTVSITVAQAPTIIKVTPATAVIEPNATQAYSATVTDQFGAFFSPSLSWNVTGGGSIDAAGQFNAGSTQGGPFTVSANAGAATGTGQISIQHANTTPSIISISATPTPVTGTNCALSVSASDDGGEAGLTYTWTLSNAPVGGSASFSVNGTNAAKNVSATFTQSGTYVFSVTVADGANLSATTNVTVIVDAMPNTIVVSPATATVLENSAQQFSASIKDQFGSALTTVPAWSVSGGGTVDASGLFTAASLAGGPFTVTATAGSVSGSAQLNIVHVNTPPVIFSLSSGPIPITSTTLAAAASDDGGEAALTYVWSLSSAPPGGAVSFSDNNSNASKAVGVTFTATGTYTIGLTVKDLSGLKATSSISINVNAVVATFSVDPAVVTIPVNGSQQFTATALDQFGHPLSVTWSQSGGVITSDGYYTASGASGSYVVTAAVGEVTQSASVTVAQGTLTGIVAIPATSTNLTTEGTTDWAHWGNSTVLSFDHKANIASQISNYAKIGTGNISRVTTAPTFTWSGGTPTAKSTGTKSGLLSSGVNNGFSITVPADGTLRRLNVYVGVTKAKGKLTATLSDGSAVPYIDLSLVSTSGTANRVYSFQYSAVSPGATLTIQWTMLSGNGSGGVSLHSVTLGSGVLSGAKIAGGTSSKKK